MSVPHHNEFAGIMTYRRFGRDFCKGEPANPSDAFLQGVVMGTEKHREACAFYVMEVAKRAQQDKSIYPLELLLPCLPDGLRAAATILSSADHDIEQVWTNDAWDAIIRFTYNLP
jgi:hypothetical protein